MCSTFAGLAAAGSYDVLDEVETLKQKCLRVCYKSTTVPLYFFNHTHFLILNQEKLSYMKVKLILKFVR
jgi:hypothetical protein